MTARNSKLVRKLLRVNEKDYKRKKREKERVKRDILEKRGVSLYRRRKTS